jgi:25S rRNA (adenine2142-N1)-methyltransferase
VPKEKKLSSASHKVTQATISTFHTLLKQRKRIERQLASSATHGQHEALERELQDIDRQVNELGGLEAYQQASTLGQSSQRGGDSSHVLIKWLKNLRASTDWEVPLR